MKSEGLRAKWTNDDPRLGRIVPKSKTPRYRRGLLILSWRNIAIVSSSDWLRTLLGRIFGMTGTMKYVQAFLLLVCPLFAQVTIKNPDHLDVPEQKVQILFHTTCQVLAREFHVHIRELEFPVVLVLGDPNERYTSDEEHRIYAVYLYRWNEAQFVASSMRLALQHMVTNGRRDRLLVEILERSRGIDTVPVASLERRR